MAPRGPTKTALVSLASTFASQSRLLDIATRASISGARVVVRICDVWSFRCLTTDESSDRGIAHARVELTLPSGDVGQHESREAIDESTHVTQFRDRRAA